MRRTRPALLMLVAATCGVPAPLNAAGPARTEQPANYVKPDDRNAALAYWEHLGTIDAATEQKLRALDWKAMDEAGEGVPAALVEVTTDELWVKVHGLVRASRLRKCNFEINYEAGPGALMPHLARMRLGGTILRAFARRAALEGNPARVGEYLAAMVRVGRHAADEPILISTLVGMAIANAAMGEAESLLRAGRLSPESRAEVSAALRALPARDPMGLRAAIEGERDVFLPWIDRAAGDEKTMKELAPCSARTSAEASSTPSPPRGPRRSARTSPRPGRPTPWCSRRGTSRTHATGSTGSAPASRRASSASWPGCSPPRTSRWWTTIASSRANSPRRSIGSMGSSGGRDANGPRDADERCPPAGGGASGRRRRGPRAVAPARGAPGRLCADAGPRPERRR